MLNPLKTASFFRKFFQPTLAALAFAIVSSAPSAQAGYIVTFRQVGPDVVATGSGPIDLTGLDTLFPTTGTSQVVPFGAYIFTGPTGSNPVQPYGGGGISGPTSFGSGFGTLADSGSGDLVGIFGLGHLLFVPLGYVSGSPLSDTATYDSASFASLGLTPGIYEWTWGTGVNQNFTVRIVPDSGSTFGLLFVGLVALFGVTRFRSRQLA